MRASDVRNTTALLLVIGLPFRPPRNAIAHRAVTRGRKPLPITTINNRESVAVDESTPPRHDSREDRLAGADHHRAAGSRSSDADQTVVSVAGPAVSLPAPTVRRDNRWLVPAEFLPRAAALGHQTRLDLRPAMRLLIVVKCACRASWRASTRARPTSPSHSSDTQHRGARHRAVGRWSCSSKPTRSSSACR